MSAFRAFFTALFGIFGAVVALALVSLLFYGIFSSAEEKVFSSDVKLLPDANGHRKKLSGSKPIILQITFDGEIGEDKLTGKKIQEHLLTSREEAFSPDRVKGILLVMNTPGGGVNDSDIIYRHLKAYKERYGVPIYTYVNGLCASGGYYIACASDKIFASDVSLIGSIGVVGWPPFFNYSGVLDKIGVSSVTLLAGKGKDELNPFRPWKEGEQERYQSLITHFYQQFLSVVSENRPIDRHVLEEKLGAGVYPADEAQKLGLIDHNGTSRNEALTALADEAGIDGEYQVVGFETESWWKKMLKEAPTSPLITGKIKHELTLPTAQESLQFYFK